MSGNRRTALFLSAAVVGGAMLMTACQDEDSGAAKGSSSSTPADTSVTPPGSSATGGSQGGGKGSGGKSSGGPGTAAGTGSGTNGKAGKCRTDQLKITAKDATITGDSDNTVAVEFKNSGGRDCAISGYAGVDLKTGAGSLSAKRTGQKADSIVLKSGQSVAFGISYPVNKSGGSGVRITGLLVTPPNETKTVALRWPGAGTLPVTEDGGSPVKVGPVGSAGQGG
ncbi:hypothetical protein A8W25_16095 [Streptomyces sp. ERV7]|uniref:DUF4232 domain-containing protein n=1 Tax=Streptomyces sp. ERV7 TaxID=1322334 RepID=UPI0007F492C8|nr:DUF4232 domain-containing protein [Streptomyces sp. ERV7]OAR23989.1 hypothetical protein A8W25_16095 [Streptomyces sp. ERV7]